MKHRNLALGGVATLTIASIFIAGTSFAQSQPRHSTPAEQAQTESLNAAQAAEPAIIYSAARGDAATKNAADIAPYNASVEAANAQAQAQYQNQLQDYQKRKGAYEAQSQAYENELKDYRDMPVVVEHHVIVDSPTVVTVAPEETHVVFTDRDRALVRLESIDNPDRELAGIPVEDRGGYRVGHFRFLTYQDEGQEKAVIMLRNNKNIALDDDHLRFDPEHDTVVANLTFDELNNMPARF